ncbi:HEAT repeat domain-containing protein [Streptomyces sp. NPDC054863]
MERLGSAHDTFLGLTLLAERAASGGAQAAEVAALLPRSVPESPEAALALAGLYEQLGPHLRGRPLPPWRAAAGLPARVRIAWLRAELLHDPSAVRREPSARLLLHAVRDADVARAHRPDLLVTELTRTGDPALRAQALRLAVAGLHAGLLTPAGARARLLELVQSAGAGASTDLDDPVVRDVHTESVLAKAVRTEAALTEAALAEAVLTEAVLTELAEPWAALDPLPPESAAAFLSAGTATATVRPGVADAALAVAARHGHGGVLRQAVEDPALPPGLRRRALELLGDLAERGEVGDLTAVAARDPLLFGGPLVACLRGMHRRGHFAADADVPALVTLALADHSVRALDLATVLFTCRHTLLRVLVDAPGTDPDWPRRLALLVALAGQGAGDLPIGAEITRVLRSLPPGPAAGPFLEALRTLRYEDAEEAVLALLPAVPSAALDALEAVGGDRTVEVLREGFGLGGDGAPGAEYEPGAEYGPGGEYAPSEEYGLGEGGGSGARAGSGIAPHLRPVRQQALGLLWQLTRDPEQRGELLSRLDPAELPLPVAADLGGPDERELALLRSHLDPHDPRAALLRLAVHGSSSTLPVLAALLLRLAGEVAASVEPGRAAPRVPPEAADRPEWPPGEPEIPQDVVDALRALGGRLHLRQRIRPRWHLDAIRTADAGHALVADLALGLLERPELGGGEQAVLLRLLLDSPSPRTRPRVHRLLRHPDRHVRKHVIALLARDATGEDAQALSATLITLTAAQDVQTVRQALLALGHARAHWASRAVAACLGHRNMNVRKTAAEVLARVGTPDAVPELLRQLGRQDNPGLRTALVRALRAVLGEAYAATVLAAAERAGDPRTRDLLLTGLHRVLSVRAILALDEQASPAAPALLALMPDHRVCPADGTLDDLAVPLAKYGLTGGPDRKRADDPDAEAVALLARGWRPEIALSIVTRDADRPLSDDQLAVLRPQLTDWLHLATSSSRSIGDRVLAFVLRLCPAPWPDGEPAVFARHLPTLLAVLGERGTPAGVRNALVAVLEAVAPTLRAVEALTVADAVRALPATAGARSALTLLRHCGAVLVRTDVERALTSAGLGADPWQAEVDVLHEAFETSAAADTVITATTATGPRPAAGDQEWRDSLAAAVRTGSTPGALHEFRRESGGVGTSRTGPSGLLATLIDVYPTAAGAPVRSAMLDWMTDLQPLGVPPMPPLSSPADVQDATRARRAVRADALDRPRSAAQRERLLAMLEAPGRDRREAAALALLAWPEPAARLPVLRAFLRGRLTGQALDGATAELAHALRLLDPAELRADGVLPAQVLTLAAQLGPWDLVPLLPLLLDRWEHGPPAARPQARQALRRIPADLLAEHLADRLAPGSYSSGGEGAGSGSWGLLDLLTGRSLLRTPALALICRRLRAEGRDDLADGIVLVDGPLRGPGAAEQDSVTLSALRDRAPAAASERRPSRRELLALARSGEPEQIRRALTRLTEEQEGRAPDPSAELRDVLAELLTHPRPGVRLHAHRTSRALLDRQTHLHLTAALLDDPQTDVRCMAVRTLCGADWEPAIPAVIGMLDHAHPVVRRTAAEGLVRLGRAAAPALRRAADHARPDKRSRYTDVLADLLDRADRPSPDGRP